MSELITRLREILAALAASDAGCKRFGAAQHRYALAPPLGDDEHAALVGKLAQLGASLSDEHDEYVTRLSAGGVGPYYGLLSPVRAVDHLIDAPSAIAAWRHGLPIAHLGCGYAAFIPLDGPARGQVWIDARALGILEPVRPSFTAFYLDWIDRLSRGSLPDAFIPPGVCALAAALSGYLGLRERELGLAAGALAGEELRAALGELGPGAIAITADGPGQLFATGDRVDPCVTCARAVDNLREQGLREGVVAPGVLALAAR